MNKPIPSVEAEFNKAGIYFFTKESFHDSKDQDKVGVTVEAAVMADAKLIDIDFMVSVKSPQGNVTSFTDWKVVDRDGQKALQFVAWKYVPKGTIWVNTTERYFSSFTDLCWLKGNEQVDPVGVPSAETKIAPGFSQSDLGWHLPCRFVDPLIDALGKLNDYMLSGTLEDAVLYGPLFIKS